MPCALNALLEEVEYCSLASIPAKHMSKMKGVSSAAAVMGLCPC